MAMTSQADILGADQETTLLDEVAMPILFGLMIGLGSGALIWISVVVHFGVIGHFLR